MTRQCFDKVSGEWLDPEEYAFRKAENRQVTARSSLPFPMIVSDFDEPVQSMADGRYYTSKSALRATYKASGNPQGVEYAEVGNEDISGFTPPKRDRKADREAIDRAISEVESGNAPPVLTETP